MTKYREILRLASLGLSQQSIADSSGVSKKTVNRVLKRAKELNIFWPLEANETDAVLAEKLFPSAQKQVSSTKRMPDFNYIQKELLRNGVNKKLLWTEYLEECRQSGDDPPNVFPVLLLHPAGRTETPCYDAYQPKAR